MHDVGHNLRLNRVRDKKEGGKERDEAAWAGSSVVVSLGVHDRGTHPGGPESQEHEKVDEKTAVNADVRRRRSLPAHNRPSRGRGFVPRKATASFSSPPVRGLHGTAHSNLNKLGGQFLSCRSPAPRGRPEPCDGNPRAKNRRAVPMRSRGGFGHAGPDARGPRLLRPAAP